MTNTNDRVEALYSSDKELSIIGAQTEASGVFLPKVLRPGGNIIDDVNLIIDQCSVKEDDHA